MNSPGAPKHCLLLRLFLFLLAPVALCCLLAVAGCTARSTPDTAFAESRYELVWADEFATDGRPDTTNWTYETGFRRNEELQWYQPENAWVEGGHLVIEARRDTFPNPDYDPAATDWRRSRPTVYYTSASLNTSGRHTWRYGRFEIRAKLRAEPGLWPAIWMLGSGQPWPEGGEIDIMEYYDSLLLANAAWADTGRHQPIWDDARLPIAEFGPDWDQDFHIWRMDWTPDAIQLYVDDRLLNSIDLSATQNQRGDIGNPFRETDHYLLLNLAIGSNGGDPAGTDFPARYLVDYVRVYQRE
jgi:beta-glucanase (GH16 family)